VKAGPRDAAFVLRTSGLHDLEIAGGDVESPERFQRNANVGAIARASVSFEETSRSNSQSCSRTLFDAGPRETWDEVVARALAIAEEVRAAHPGASQAYSDAEALDTDGEKHGRLGVVALRWRPPHAGSRR
jgi:hypothetical protein